MFEMIVSNICCCIDLRSGGIIVGCVEAIYSCYSLFSIPLDKNLYGLPFVIGIIIGVCLLYGIIGNRPSYVSFCIYVTGILLILVYTPLVLLLTYLPFSEKEKAADIKRGLNTCSICSVILTYIWIVKYSVYKKMKENASGLAFSGVALSV
ncbi:uncharacterized protein LOC116344266 [Contarinia nasturtii]|uniref:uncharacterized protein LOC116344266 n=1 Tax=Contarinia nasturtii TaxID=265458 RepID=UPI0012D3F9A1|nr:uncharacterized protein LOC116344266 [Contarinia nasturtii]